MNPGEQDELFEQLIRKAVRQYMENIEAPDAEVMWQRICERIEQCEREKEAARLRRRVIFRRLTVAAAACLVLGVGGLTALRMGGSLLLTSDKEQLLIEADERGAGDYGFNDQVAAGEIQITGENAEDQRSIFLPSGCPPYAADEFLLVGGESLRAVEHVFTVEQFAHADGRQLTRVFAPAEGLDRERFQAGLEEIIPARLRITGENEGVFNWEDPQGYWGLIGLKDDYWVCLYTGDAVLAEQLPSLYLLWEREEP